MLYPDFHCWICGSKPEEPSILFKVMFVFTAVSGVISCFLVANFQILWSYMSIHLEFVMSVKNNNHSTPLSVLVSGESDMAL